ncbi:BtrH N-terminal domain-containing protein [Halovivax limisalsi]|uniref:BtrH N-terminal domain-containing protein n=1 Tax=Halovivax limisalsi TaxID=1453760 RepID=UPI001FFD819C|nr:BtrH N-terminal domain-containing protein [Halovivax limisalsi]
MVRVDGYVHHTGDHCGSTSLRNLAGRYDWGVDEPTCFGLAAGLGFTYFELARAPHRGFFGRPLWIEDAFFEHLGIGYERWQPGIAAEPDTDDERWAAVVDRLRDRTAAGDPVMVFTDIFHLEYFDTGTHFAPHTILVVDVDGDEVVLSDSEFDAVQRVPIPDLRAAMGSDAVFDLGYRHLVVTDPEPTVDLATAARAAIETTADAMLDPNRRDRPLGRGSHGLDGIRAFADDLPAWTDLPDPQWTARFAYQNVERRGTGGGAFRSLYARFLHRMIAELPELDPALAERTAAIADDWTSIGETLKTASELDRATDSEFPELLADASDAIRGVADREERLARDLLEAVSN